MTFRTANGALGTGVWNFVGVRSFDQIEIEGEQGRVAFSTFGHEPITLHNPRRRQNPHLRHPPARASTPGANHRRRAQRQRLLSKHRHVRRPDLRGDGRRAERLLRRPQRRVLGATQRVAAVTAGHVRRVAATGLHLIQLAL